VLRVPRGPGCACRQPGAPRRPIASEAIDAPLFVVGAAPAPAPRSCSSSSRSTPRCALRSRGRHSTHSAVVERSRPSIRSGAANSRKCEQEFWSDVHPEFMTMHELASDLPCEMRPLPRVNDFAGPHWSMLFDTPTFTGWQLEPHRAAARPGSTACTGRMLQTFPAREAGGGSRAEGAGCSNRRDNLPTLAQVFAEYPDAKVIHTHRDPRRFHRLRS